MSTPNKLYNLGLKKALYYEVRLDKKDGFSNKTKSELEAWVISCKIRNITLEKASLYLFSDTRAKIAEAWEKIPVDKNFIDIFNHKKYLINKLKPILSEEGLLYFIVENPTVDIKIKFSKTFPDGYNVLDIEVYNLFEDFYNLPIKLHITTDANRCVICSEIKRGSFSRPIFTELLKEYLKSYWYENSSL